MVKTGIYFFLGMVLLFTSCQDDSKKNEPTALNTSVAHGNTDSSKTPMNDVADFKFQMVIANIPSPFEMIGALTKSGVIFNNGLVNKPENETNYLTSIKKALNYGVYGVDMAYISANSENTQALKYFKVLHNLARSLGAAESLDKIAGSRLENHWDNKDTITKIMDETYAATDKYLRSGERQIIATEILTGCWVESQYLLLDALKEQTINDKNRELFKKLYEQKLHLNNLNSLLKEYSKEKDFMAIIEKINNLNERFKSITVVDDLNTEKISSIAVSVKEIRDLIIK